MILALAGAILIALAVIATVGAMRAENEGDAFLLAVVAGVLYGSASWAYVFYAVGQVT